MIYGFAFPDIMLTHMRPYNREHRTAAYIIVPTIPAFTAAAIVTSRFILLFFEYSLVSVRYLSWYE